METGNHAELISKCGVYYDLVEAQKGKKREGSSQVAESSRRFSVAGAENVSTALGPTSSNISVEKDDLINFHEVEFRYPSRPEQKIFRGLEMSVKEGETLAIVGPR